MGDRRRLGVGERAGDFVLSGQSGGPERFYSHAGGRPTVVLFDDGDGTDARRTDLADRLSMRDDVAMCCVTSRAVTAEESVPTWSDPEGTVAQAYGVAPGELTAVVLDPNLCVLRSIVGNGLVDQVVLLLDAAVDRSPAAEVVAQAPVLLIPRVVEATYRDRLIEVWEEESSETGVQRAGGDGIDAEFKRRRDHTVTDPHVLRELSSEVGRRIMPEIEKAFAFRATRFEGFKIACYDAASGGFFRPHRDNLSPSTAHRVFALTINLNDDYAGGQLRFPEYGNQLYRPAAGSALVFSCAHLHEVREVTAGRRFVLLSFLYGGATG